MVDEVEIIRDILSDNWNAGNVPLPEFYYTGADLKGHRFAEGDAILLYEVSHPANKPRGLGHTAESREKTISIDIRTKGGRSRFLDLRTEVNRIRKLKRISPHASFERLEHVREKPVSSYVKFWHYVIDVRLYKYAEAIS